MSTARSRSRPETDPAASRRRQTRFLLVFLLLVGFGFGLLSLNWVNDHLVVPFTDRIAVVSAALLNVLGQQVTLEGSRILGSRFGVEILNGCNGVETMTIFAAAVLAFPAPWRARALGLAVGLVAIQLFNLVRIVALYLTGAYLPRFFDTSHTVVWQTLVIAFGVLLWMLWASRVDLTSAADAEPA
jgi:exosortase H (IPTLxxWG-CTERM-specific)